MDTLSHFDVILTHCREVFLKKTRDYGTAWRILRPSSLTDQLYIKAKRIRTIEENREQKVQDPISGEYQGIINYSIMALIQLKNQSDHQLDLEEALNLFDAEVAHIKNLLGKKNHDYGEAWRDMRVSSITDMILMKLLRVKQIEENEGRTLISEGLDANYQDIVNYAVFALIKLEETTNS